MKNIIATILLVSSIAIFFGYINSEYAHIGDQRAQAAQYDLALNNATELRTERDNLLKKYNNFNPADVARITSLLPDGVDNVKLVLDINDVASRYGMNIKDIKIDQSDDSQSSSQFGPSNTPYGSLALSFTITSSYENFLLFLQDLEKNLRLVDLTGLSFTANKDSTYDFNVTLQTYWLK
jgi:Tfp pilus assembly protein PilO